MRTSIIIFVLMFFPFDVFPSIVDGQHVWYPGGWQNRIYLKAKRSSGSKDAFVEFYSGGLCRKDGSDIIVVDEFGKLVPREITTIGPGDRYLVTFKLTGAGNYILYYNIQGPVNITLPSFRRESGVLMKVFRLVGDTCRNVDDLTIIVNKSKELIGSGYRRSIHDGFNPYADSDNYLAVYSGNVNVEKSGEYAFATNSNDSSFLFVDGKLITSFPGRHFAWATYGQKNGKVKLSKGPHRITCYHVEFNGGQSCTAGWKRPGESRFEIIPADSFGQISSCTIYRHESKNGPLYDFTFSYGEALYSGKVNSSPIVEMEFQPRISNEKKVKEIYWEFGDGKPVRERAPSRLFLRQGMCRVKMIVVDKYDKRHTMTHTIPVYPIELYNSKDPDSTADRFEKMLTGYDYRSLDYIELSTLFDYYAVRSDERKVVVIGAKLVNAYPDEKPEEKKRFLRCFAVFMEEKPYAHYALKERIYKEIISLAGNDRFAGETSLKLATVYYESGKQLDKAKELCKRIIGAEFKYSSILKTKAMVCLGNITLEENRKDEAEKYYHRASDLHVRNRKNIMFNDVYAFSVDNQIRNSNCYQAFVLLDKWELRDPMARLEGYTLILRVRAFLKMRDAANAIRYSKVLVDNMGPTPYSPEAYSILITLLRQAGLDNEESKYLDRFKKEYPESRYLQNKSQKSSNVAEIQPGKDR